MKRMAEAKPTEVLASELPIRLHLRTDLHLARKLWHLLTGLLISFIYLFSGISTGGAVVLLSSILGVALLVETARLHIPAVNERVLRIWAPFMRSHEYSAPSALPHYLLATVIAIGIFPKPVAVLSILYLACGDPMASLFGILYGNRSVRWANGKSLVGTVAGVVTCFLVGFIFLNTLALPMSAVLPISIIGGIAGGTVELVPVEVDDNLSIPVLSGFVLWLAFIVFGI